MTTRDYPRLSIEEFGKQLIVSGDLDPVYIGLYKLLSEGKMEGSHLNRWLLAYSCLYHCGVASYLSEYEGWAFFDKLELAARNEKPAPTGDRWPRAKERRHWRGTQAILSHKALVDRYGSRPERFVDYVAHHWAQGVVDAHATRSFTEIAGRVQDHLGFGRWIAFKMADIVDRLGLARVEFKFDDVVIYDDPLLAAEMLVRQRLGLPENAQVKRSAIKEVFDYLQIYFSDYAAPPMYDRPVGLAEIETVLCKWKSHTRGHYPVHNDIVEISEGIAPWMKHSGTAMAFAAALPKLPQEAEICV